MTDPSDPAYGELVVQLSSETPELARVLSDAERNRVRELDRYLNKDTLKDRAPGCYLLGLEELFTCLDDLASAYKAEATLSGIAFLVQRARADFETAFEAALSGLNGVVLDAMRDVMEIEHLLRDFSYDTDRINEWLQDKTPKFFRPYQLRKRHAQALGTDVRSLGDSADYQLHSQGLHVSPHFPLDDLAGKGFVKNPSVASIELCFWEMFEHARRVTVAAHSLGGSCSAWTVPSPDSYSAIVGAWQRTRKTLHAYVLLERLERENSQP